MALIKHEKIEKNSTLLLVLSLLTVSIGGLVEIAPLFYLESTIEKVEGMRPYTPLELAGRDIYIGEGCYNCHSQMVRSLKDEVERYGPYSLAAESMYDHPFQWGSKRTGPDLARVGGKYSDEWHVAHLADPAMVENALADLAAQADPDADTTGLEARYPKAPIGAFVGDPAHLTEMDALVAYLQMLGTLVDFKVYDAEANQR